MPLVLARYSTLRTMEYFRVPRDMTLRIGDMVVLKTRRGTEMGQVKGPVGDPELGPRDGVGGEVLRRTTIEDATKFREAKNRDVKPLRRTFKELAAKYKLPARFAAAEELLGGEKLVVYFSSEDRIDFRDLVKDLTDATGQRIELRQVGARDAARVTGDVGVCGVELCCISYIIDFVPVSMKMAKSQRISLDPAKISGQCGRLKCCLKYEDDLYNELKQHVPQEGQPVVCDGKDCHACSVDILGQKVTVDFGDGTREQRDIKDITFEHNWSEKDIRRYRKERRATIRAEKEARLAEKQARADRRNQPRPESPERRQQEQAGHQERRAADLDESARMEPVEETDDAPDESDAPDVTDTAAVPPDSGVYTVVAQGPLDATPDAADDEESDDEDDVEDAADDTQGAGPETQSAGPAAPQGQPGQQRPPGEHRRRRRRGRRRGRRPDGGGNPPPSAPPSPAA